MSDDALPGAKGKQKSLEYEEAREDHQWTDIDYLTCPPMLVAFLLDENPARHTRPEVEKKELVQNLTRRFETKEVSEGSHQDTGEGQGGNLIIFLTGPPGVGKSLTAEVVAEETHRPFYRVSAGELGVDPSALEKQLGNVFLLARCWGAIILIDKADMFMAKRRASMPDQNAERSSGCSTPMTECSSSQAHPRTLTQPFMIESMQQSSTLNLTKLSERTSGVVNYSAPLAPPRDILQILRGRRRHTGCWGTSKPMDGRFATSSGLPSS
ncbi:ATP-dependent zinc metalloprotease FtsH 2 [Colletotrichum fructicola]|nr:ATP-dependent zinc metalloprotease FtsH 2 [Colletotrichum fructicola]